MCAKSLSYVQLLGTLWTVARQAPLSMGFPWREHWSGLPCPPPGDLPDPGIKHESPETPALQVDYLQLSHRGSPKSPILQLKKKKFRGNSKEKKKRNWLSWLERFKKPHDLQSGSWRPRRANDVVTVQKPADLRLRKSQCISSHLKAIKTNVPAQRCQAGGVPLTHRKISGFCSIHAFTWLNEAHHIENIYLLYLDFQFKC